MTLEKAVAKYHWLEINPEDGAIEIFLDHHALSSYRACEAYFELNILNSIRPKHRIWNLDFGVLFHSMIEEFYESKKAGNYELLDWLSHAIIYWEKYKFEEHSEHKMFKVLGGLHGFVVMLTQYADHFAKEADRLRVIGTEIKFGKQKEVLLGEFKIDELDRPKEEFFTNCIVETRKVRCYLTGRIDFLMDNGIALGPLDHKTSAFFSGNPADGYDPQDGMTGYVFATKQLVTKMFPEIASERKLDRIWMNFASISPDKDGDPMKRFRRIPIFKTEWQLERYRQRQLSTFKKILEFILSGREADWATDRCSNFWRRDCQYKNLHRQNSASNMLTILNNDFVQGKSWDPEHMED